MDALTLLLPLRRCSIGRMRGTAATQFMVRGYRTDQVDLFLGWKPGESAYIRRKYIDARNVAKGVQAFLSAMRGSASPPRDREPWRAARSLRDSSGSRTS
jgi:hypothetical protein